VTLPANLNDAIALIGSLAHDSNLWLGLGTVALVLVVAGAITWAIFAGGPAMNADEILHCGECDGAAVIHEVTPTYTVLAHVRTPVTVHPVRLARTTDERSTSQAGLAVSGDIRRSSEGSRQPDAAGSPSHERTAVPLRSSSNPQRRARRTGGSPPGPLDPRSALSAGALDRRG